MSADAHDHEIWRERAAVYALDALTGDERREFETHLKSCAECAAELLTLRPAADALSQSVPQLDPPPALRDRVMSAALGERRAPAVTSPPAKAARVEPQQTSSLRWLPVAAMLLLALGLGMYANGLRGRVSRLETELDDARAQSAALQARVERDESTLASTQGQLASAQGQLAVVTAPDARRVTLAGQKGAPGASGLANWSPTRGLALSVSNLPQLLPMRDYQVWLLTKDKPVSAGLLPRDAVDGRTVVFSARSGVEPIGVALSEEPAGGVEQPGDRIYLVGLIARAQ
ncbi:MAG TPA: anti-sigma factor [Vicinamibacterales bacterium]|jgi:anti-sigma-K factor RskA